MGLSWVVSNSEFRPLQSNGLKSNFPLFKVSQDCESVGTLILSHPNCTSTTPYAQLDMESNRIQPPQKPTIHERIQRSFFLGKASNISRGTKCFPLCFPNLLHVFPKKTWLKVFPIVYPYSTWDISIYFHVFFFSPIKIWPEDTAPLISPRYPQGTRRAAGSPVLPRFPGAARRSPGVASSEASSSEPPRPSPTSPSSTCPG